MTFIRSFKEIDECLKKQKTVKRVAVVCGTDSHSQYALSKAIEAGFIKVVMVGPRKEVESYPIFEKYPGSVRFIDVLDVDEAARIAVQLIREGDADILMKGNINTDNLLRVVLDKNDGILPAGKLLTHLSIAQIPRYDKLLFFMDAAVIPYPSFEQRVSMIQYTAAACHKFGIEKPNIALIHFTEKVNKKFPNSTDYVKLVDEAAKGTFGEVVVDGPIDISTACEKECGNIKGIESPIGGQADALMFPNIDASNVFYKTLCLFGQAEMAGLLMGPDCPVVVTSRGDSGQTKFNSIAMACLITR